jgi:glutaminyl-tRNA synthetase
MSHNPETNSSKGIVKASANNTEANAPVISNFLRSIIDSDLQKGAYHRLGLPNVITRFPPEPNGYLHIGHAKSICLNFGLARVYQGRCHLRFDDTNPSKEEQEYVDDIINSIRWLGFSWEAQEADKKVEHLYYASDYFEKLYAMAESLIQRGYAYVDSQSAEEIAANRGDFSRPGVNSVYRNRPMEESLDLFRRMRAGEFPDATHVLRAKTSEDAMSNPNMNMRDPVIYRIRHVHHHRTGNAWCVYPMYDYTHPLSDAIENKTHSICTLEFQDHRPFYDWVIARCVEGGFLAEPVPHQYEFARLNLSYTVTSKRKLLQLVEEGVVTGWDDPRMPTLVGLRRRGFTPQSIQLFCERIGVSKADGWIDMSTLEACVREDLDPKAPRAVVVLRPLKLIIDNFPEGESVLCSAPIHPHDAERGERSFSISKEVWIEQEDFMEVPVKGYFRLFPGNKVRLRYGFVVECTGCEKDAKGNVIAVHCTYFPDSKSGTPGSSNYKVKGNIHWVDCNNTEEIEVRLYDRLFKEAYPDAGGKDFKLALNPDSCEVVKAYAEIGLTNAKKEARYQFERHGYFVVDQEKNAGSGLAFNRIVTLKDSWVKS